MQKVQKKGLVADLWPNIRIIQFSGLFISSYYSDNSTMMKLLRKIYSWLVTVILFGQFLALVGWAVARSYDADQRAKHSVTVLFFTHTLIKYMYFAMNSDKFHRTLAMWNTPNTHLLFAESNARHRAIILSRFRKVLTFVLGVTVFTVTAWTMLTLVEDDQYRVPDPETENGTMFVRKPRLLVPSLYPFEHFDGPAHIGVLVLQVGTRNIVRMIGRSMILNRFAEGGAEKLLSNPQCGNNLVRRKKYTRSNEKSIIIRIYGSILELYRLLRLEKQRHGSLLKENDS